MTDGCVFIKILFDMDGRASSVQMWRLAIESGVEAGDKDAARLKARD